jgi:hypothetical protein
VLSWPLKMRAGKGSFFFGRLKEALKKISAGRHPVLAELHESFLGQAGGALELAAGKHYQCDTANAEVRKDGRPASPRVAEQAKEVLRTFNRVEGPLLYPRVLDPEFRLESERANYILRGVVDVLASRRLRRNGNLGLQGHRHASPLIDFAAGLRMADECLCSALQGQGRSLPATGRAVFPQRTQTKGGPITGHGPALARRCAPVSKRMALPHLSNRVLMPLTSRRRTSLHASAHGLGRRHQALRSPTMRRAIFATFFGTVAHINRLSYPVRMPI